MEMDDLVVDVANEVVDGDKSQISMILLMIIGTIIGEVIKLIFKKFSDRNKAAEEFIYYYKNMGPLRKLRWSFKVRAELKKHDDLKISSDKLATSLSNKFKNMTVDDVLSIAKNVTIN